MQSLRKQLHIVKRMDFNDVFKYLHRFHMWVVRLYKKQKVKI